MANQENVLQVSGVLDPACTSTELHLAGGRVVRVPTAMLLGGAGSDADDAGDGAFGSERVVAVAGETVIPLVEERLEVGRRVVETGRVLLHKTVETFAEQLNEPLAVRTFDIERVAVNRVVDRAPEVRVEGDTTVYPLVEERLILTKELILKEEVRVTRRETERRDTQVVELRREHLVVDREQPKTS